MQTNYTISFNDWLRSKSGRFYASISASFAIIFASIPIFKNLGFDVASILTKLFATIEPNWLTLSFFVHTLFILFVIVFAGYKYVDFEKSNEAFPEEKVIWERLKMNRPGTPHPITEEDKQKLWIRFKVATNRVVRQFTTWWFWCWFAWLVLYTIILINSTSNEHRMIPDVWQNLANNISSLMFGFMFMTFTVSTSRFGFVYWIRLGIPVLAIFLVEYFTSTPETTIWYSLFSGVIASFSMAAFFGCINSKFINVPIWLILVLHLYAAIQPLYVFFGDYFGKFEYAEVIKVFVSMVAFLCKILLFLISTWILQTGRLAFFIIEESSLNFKRNEDFETFLKVTKLRGNKLSTNDFPE